MAKISRTPGRTQHLVFFKLDEDSRLVDLPGYGYAKVPEHIKQQWQKDMSEYFAHRQCLTGAVLVMDVRRPLTKFDQMMLDWCVRANLPTQIILTKSDKLKKGAANNSLLKVKNEIKQHPYVDVQLFSSLKKQGLEALGLRLPKTAWPPTYHNSKVKNILFNATLRDVNLAQPATISTFFYF